MDLKVAWAQLEDWPYWPCIVQSNALNSRSQLTVTFIDKIPTKDDIDLTRIVLFDPTVHGIPYKDASLNWAVKKAMILHRSSKKDRQSYIDFHKLPKPSKRDKLILRPCNVTLSRVRDFEEEKENFLLEEKQKEKILSRKLEVRIPLRPLGVFSRATKKRYREYSDDDDDSYFTDEGGESDEENRKPAKFTVKLFNSKRRKIEEEEELSEYEKIKLKNIAEREALFKALKTDADQFKRDLIKQQRPSNAVKSRRRSFNGFHFVPTRKDPILTRSKRGDRVKMTIPSNEEELNENYKYEEIITKKKRKSMPHRWSFNPNENILSPDDVTNCMLEAVCYRVSDKIYNAIRGTTCHQCRQKTMDTKTICRSGNCSGGRGLFCGVCLKNRYGEDARKALKDPNWTCPPCLDICNCSICRNRLGKEATGPITFLAQEKGFHSVKDYLQSLSNQIYDSCTDPI